MFKICICVRNRLGITKKCIEAITKHTNSKKYEIYIYDNLTNYRLNDHFTYFNKLFQKDIIQQYTVNSDKSTFNAFSKVVAINQFGHHHLMDPRRNDFEFIVLLDNDMIVMPDWDLYLYDAWKFLKSKNDKYIKIVTQFPGGIKHAVIQPYKIRDANVYTGKLGGSGFWAVNTDFFNDVGFLNCANFINIHKKHDQLYWLKLARASRNNNYILAINERIVLHAGGIAGSVCNSLTKQSNSLNKLEKIKFKEVDAKIEKLTFDEFFSSVKDKSKLFKW